MAMSAKINPDDEGAGGGGSSSTAGQSQSQQALEKEEAQPQVETVNSQGQILSGGKPTGQSVNPSSSNYAGNAVAAAAPAPTVASTQNASSNSASTSPTGATSAQAAAEQTAINNLNSDIAAGQAYTTASGAFTPGAMGRVNATTDTATADALAKAQALENGYDSTTMEAQKELNDQSIGQQEQANMMQLQSIQGAQGLRGGSAAAQQVGVMENAMGQQEQATRQAAVDNLAAQQAGVQNFLQDNLSNNQVNTTNEEYNQQQANAEAAGRLSSPLTYAGLIQGVRSGADANTIAQQGAATAATSANNANAIAQANLVTQQEAAAAAAQQAQDDENASVDQNA